LAAAGSAASEETSKLSAIAPTHILFLMVLILLCPYSSGRSRSPTSIPNRLDLAPASTHMTSGVPRRAPWGVAVGRVGRKV
jgi:hypothetical protein